MAPGTPNIIKSHLSLSKPNAYYIKFSLSFANPPFCAVWKNDVYLLPKGFLKSKPNGSQMPLNSAIKE